jgi:hypothetical protein
MANRPRCSLAIDWVQCHCVSKPENKLPVRGGDHTTDALRRDGVRTVTANLLSVNTRLMPWLNAGEHNAFAIRKEARVIVIDSILRNLLRLSGTEGYEDECAGNAHGRRGEYPSHVGGEVIAHALSETYRRRAIGRTHIMS